jgi:hypothetical protein
MTVAFGCVSLFAEEEKLLGEMYVPSARMSALGGPHAALNDDLSTLFHNPAGFNTPEPEMSFAEITAHVGGPLFDIAGIIADAASGGTDVLTSPQTLDLMRGLYTSATVLGPVAFGYVGNGLGFGIFNTTRATIENKKPLTLTSSIGEQLIMCGGYSFRIPLPEKTNSTLDAGLLLKGSLRGSFEIEKSFLQVPSLISSIGPSLLNKQPFDFVTAIGFDVGLRYSYNEVFTVGIAGRNIFTPTLRSSYDSVNKFLGNNKPDSTTTGIVPLDLSVGTLFSPRLEGAERILSDLKIMLDYNDILDFLTHPETSKHPLLNLGLGVELGLLEILSLRAGFYEGLFAAGIGLDLHFFTLNTSMFGRELSSEPGMRPVYNMMVGLEFRF